MQAQYRQAQPSLGGIERAGALGAELVNIDTRLEAEGLWLACEWRQLRVSINLVHLQHERTRTEMEESLAASREARDRALEEARAMDR